MSKFRKWLIHKLGGFTESYIHISKDGVTIGTDGEIKTGIKELLQEVTKDEN